MKINFSCRKEFLELISAEKYFSFEIKRKLLEVILFFKDRFSRIWILNFVFLEKNRLVWDFDFCKNVFPG